MPCGGVQPVHYRDARGWRKGSFTAWLVHQPALQMRLMASLTRTGGRVFQIIEIDSDKASAAMRGEQAEAIQHSAFRLVAIVQVQRDRLVSESGFNGSFPAIAGRIVDESPCEHFLRRDDGASSFFDAHRRG